MACQVLKNRKAAGEIIRRLSISTEKVVQDIRAGKVADGAQAATEAQEVALHEYARVRLHACVCVHAYVCMHVCVHACVHACVPSRRAS